MRRDAETVDQPGAGLGKDQAAVDFDSGADTRAPQRSVLAFMGRT